MPEPASVSIVLVDDHAILRQGLRSVLERDPAFRIVGEASTAAEALAVVPAQRPTVVLLDLKLSTGSDSEGLVLCRRLTDEYPDISVLVLTTFLDDNLVMEAVQAGAMGYVVKDVDTTALTDAIKAVARGENAFDSRSVNSVVRTLSGRKQPETGKLTDRELTVLRLLAQGLSNQAIGQELFISQTTAKFHVGNIMRKLEVSRRAEAVYAASKRGLI
ncbi:DNA-binding response regulator [Amycolatopsis antarctica]|uniref:DNA-binding response regulator n=1 Tax=Amycolatopsis antarctica TaxID=1854586 RepID=A0A263CZR0_9PSEU|nr:response regulator transcription factor [Amycolatopsis antarctica]OZM71670.1 DNA-binding response regulator [Amycolatopsis antarctica]